MYADDTKIYSAINNIEDCLNLQRDLDRFSVYCQKNLLDLNVNKCYVITFTRKINDIKFDYFLSNNIISRTKCINDLGVRLYSKLLFTVHFDYICATSLKMLGLLKRTMAHFRKGSAYKVVYCAYVRSNLEYVSPVWCPAYSLHISSLESVQRKFLNFLNYRLRLSIGDYESSLKEHGLLSLSARRTVADMRLLYDVIQSCGLSQAGRARGVAHAFPFNP